MPSLTTSFGSAGPLISIGVAVSAPREAALVAAGRPVPTPMFAAGLVDTGASIPCVDPSIIKTLELSPTGSAPMHTPSSGTTGHVCNLFDVMLWLLMDGQIHVASLTIPVAEAQLSQHGFDALIGRDVLDQGMMFYNGPSKSITLCF